MVVAARVFLGQRVNLQEKYDYPGYGATSRVIVACARTLLRQDAAPAGLLTPGAALGMDALPELERLAELRFVPESLGEAKGA